MRAPAPARDAYLPSTEPVLRTAEPVAAAPKTSPAAELAVELRKARLARVLALRAEGIGATLPTPTLHDEPAKGEPERLVRSWYTAAERAGLDPREQVLSRGRQLLDALEAQARTERSVACLRETVCYSAKVVDWAMATEPGAPASGSRRYERVSPLSVIAQMVAEADAEERAEAEKLAMGAA